MKLSDLKNINKICILGLGVEGRASLEFLKYFFPEKEYIVADAKDGEDYLEKQNGCDLVIKSPGISKSLVKGNYTTATNIFFANVKGLTIGVTGTKGKSTTSSLIYEILKKTGKQAHLVGNIGNPMLAELLGIYKSQGIKSFEDLNKKGLSPHYGDLVPTLEDIFVIELSSYQLDDIQYSPNISVITNLYGDHMDYHGSLENYQEAKKNIVKYATEQDYFVFNSEIERLKELADNSNAKPMPFGMERIYAFPTEGLPLIGEHNKSNMKAAYAVAKILEISDENILEAFKNFKPLKHRLEFIGKYNNILFYDDAISTTPESTIAAINALPDVHTIFLGGLDRGYDFENLAKTIAESGIENIVLFPDSGEKIFEALMNEKGKDYRILKTDSMQEAVRFAFDNTRKNHVCLLSTASPSYSLWKNFEEKGDEFRKYVETSYEFIAGLKA